MHDARRSPLVLQRSSFQASPLPLTHKHDTLEHNRSQACVRTLRLLRKQLLEQGSRRSKLLRPLSRLALSAAPAGAQALSGVSVLVRLACIVHVCGLVEAALSRARSGNPAQR